MLPAWQTSCEDYGAHYTREVYHDWSEIMCWSSVILNMLIKLLNCVIRLRTWFKRDTISFKDKINCKRRAFLQNFSSSNQKVIGWTLIWSNQILSFSLRNYKRVSLALLRSSNTGNIFAQLISWHCCVASWKGLLPVLPSSLSTCHATNFNVASCGS